LALLRGKAPEEVRRAQAQRDEAQARLRQMQKGLRQETIDAAKARMETAKARAALSQLQVKQTEELVQRNVESPLTLEVRRTELIARQNEVLEAQLTLATLEAGAVDEQIEAAKQTVLAREAALGVAQSDLKEIDVIASDLSIRRAELNQAEIELKRAEDRRVQAVLAREQVKVAEAELKKAEADIEGRQAVIRGMAFFSPVDGIVLRTFEHEGEVCRKGVPTILVADVSTGWWIEGFITEYDASRVRPGQKARVELVIGSGDYVNAVVEAVGLSTTAINRDGNGGRSLAAESRDMVWVKLQPVNTNRQPIPGTSAEVVIRVR
jgi:multidrug resistance efflux pump